MLLTSDGSMFLVVSNDSKLAIDYLNGTRSSQYWSRAYSQLNAGGGQTLLVLRNETTVSEVLQY